MGPCRTATSAERDARAQRRRIGVRAQAAPPHDREDRRQPFDCSSSVVALLGPCTSCHWRWRQAGMRTLANARLWPDSAGCRAFQSCGLSVVVVVRVTKRQERPRLQKLVRGMRSVIAVVSGDESGVHDDIGTGIDSRQWRRREAHKRYKRSPVELYRSRSVPRAHLSSSDGLKPRRNQRP